MHPRTAGSTLRCCPELPSADLSVDLLTLDTSWSFILVFLSYLFCLLCILLSLPHSASSASLRLFPQRHPPHGALSTDRLSFLSTLECLRLDDQTVRGRRRPVWGGGAEGRTPALKDADPWADWEIKVITLLPWFMLPRRLSRCAFTQLSCLIQGAVIHGLSLQVSL